MILKPTPEMPE